MADSTKNPVARKKPFRPSKQMKSVIHSKLIEARKEFNEQYGDSDNPYFDPSVVLAEYDAAIANFAE